MGLPALSGGRPFRRLGEVTWTELVAGEPPLIVVPIGSCEQHGPHLPLDTDTRIATAVAETLAANDPTIVVAPALGISSSGEHSGFPGTLSIGAAATQTVLIELVRSADWSAGVVFVNGHGGNHAPVEQAVTLLTDEGRRVMSWWPRIAAGDAHAGRAETSLMLALAPDAVRMDHARAGATAPIATLIDRLRAEGVRAVSPNGVLGDPAGSSTEEGQRILASLFDDAQARIAAWRRQVR